MRSRWRTVSAAALSIAMVMSVVVLVTATNEGRNVITPQSEQMPNCCWQDPDCPPREGETVQCLRIGQVCNPMAGIDWYCHYTQIKR